MKLATIINQLRRRAPKGPTRYGQLYAKPEATKRRYKRITLWTVFVSQENTHMILPHVFAKNEPMSPAEWSRWFGQLVDENGEQRLEPEVQRLTYIHRVGILPGLAIRTNKTWAVKKIIGWIGNARDSVSAAKPSKRRYQTKQKRK